jgi:hypothetical protein
MHASFNLNESKIEYKDIQEVKGKIPKSPKEIKKLLGE